MDSESVSSDITKSFAFQVEAVPQKDVVDVKTTSTKTPINLKIKVRKKENATVNHGVLSVPKLGQLGIPKLVRLISSDQTVLSFKVFMQSDLEKKSSGKARGHLFARCLSTEQENDDPPYIANSTHRLNTSNDINKLDELLKEKYVMSKNKFVNNGSKKEKEFFGKCKPGGCLDPPFGEEKYAYALAKPTQKNASSLMKLKDKAEDRKISEIKNLVPEEQTKIGTDESVNIQKSKEVIPIEQTCEEDKITSSLSILSLYQAQFIRTSLDSKYSDSIITYPPPASSIEICTENNIITKNRVSSENKSRKSYNELSSDIYFIPRKSINSCKETNNEKNIIQEGSNAILNENNQSRNNINKESNSNVPAENKSVSVAFKENIEQDNYTCRTDTDRETLKQKETRIVTTNEDFDRNINIKEIPKLSSKIESALLITENDSLNDIVKYGREMNEKKTEDKYLHKSDIKKYTEIKSVTSEMSADKSEANQRIIDNSNIHVSKESNSIDKIYPLELDGEYNKKNDQDNFNIESQHFDIHSNITNSELTLNRQKSWDKPTGETKANLAKYHNNYLEQNSNIELPKDSSIFAQQHPTKQDFQLNKKNVLSGENQFKNNLNNEVLEDSKNINKQVPVNLDSGIIHQLRMPGKIQIKIISKENVESQWLNIEKDKTISIKYNEFIDIAEIFETPNNSEKNITTLLDVSQYTTSSNFRTHKEPTERLSNQENIKSFATLDNVSLYNISRTLSETNHMDINTQLLINKLNPSVEQSRNNRNEINNSIDNKGLYTQNTSESINLSSSITKEDSTSKVESEKGRKTSWAKHWFSIERDVQESTNDTGSRISELEKMNQSNVKTDKTSVTTDTSQQFSVSKSNKTSIHDSSQSSEILRYGAIEHRSVDDDANDCQKNHDNDIYPTQKVIAEEYSALDFLSAEHSLNEDVLIADNANYHNIINETDIKPNQNIIGDPYSTLYLMPKESRNVINIFSDYAKDTSYTQNNRSPDINAERNIIEKHYSPSYFLSPEKNYDKSDLAQVISSSDENYQQNNQSADVRFIQNISEAYSTSYFLPQQSKRNNVDDDKNYRQENHVPDIRIPQIIVDEQHHATYILSQERTYDKNHATDITPKNSASYFLSLEEKRDKDDFIKVDANKNYRQKNHDPDIRSTQNIIEKQISSPYFLSEESSNEKEYKANYNHKIHAIDIKPSQNFIEEQYSASYPLSQEERYGKDDLHEVDGNYRHNNQTTDTTSKQNAIGEEYALSYFLPAESNIDKDSQRMRGNVGTESNIKHKRHVVSDPLSQESSYDKDGTTDNNVTYGQKPYVSDIKLEQNVIGKQYSRSYFLSLEKTDDGSNIQQVDDDENFREKKHYNNVKSTRNIKEDSGSYFLPKESSHIKNVLLDNEANYSQKIYDTNIKPEKNIGLKYSASYFLSQENPYRQDDLGYAFNKQESSLNLQESLRKEEPFVTTKSKPRNILKLINSKNYGIEDYIDSASIQSYQNNENERTFITIDVSKDPQRHPEDSIIPMKTQINSNSRKIKIPIVSEKYMEFEISTNVASQKDLNLSIDANTTDSKDNYVKETLNLCTISDAEAFQVALTLIYEQQLVPLQNVIKDLRQQIELLAKQQLWMKDKLQKTKNSKQLRLTYSNRKCGCTSGRK